jgi:hypothetical protein
VIEELAALVEAIDRAAKSADALPALLLTLRGDLSDLFSDAALLKGGRGGGAFVAVRSHGFVGFRTWMRWPLRRLFARMQPSRITNPCALDKHALAIPFSYHAERYVVLASLTKRACDADCRGFFQILERMTVPTIDRVSSASTEIPATPMEPVILGFCICDELFERIRGTLQHRGWTFERLTSFQHLWNRLQQGVPEVIAVDLDEMHLPLAAMIGIHRAADSAMLRIVGFGSARFNQYGAVPVIDCVLAHDEDRETIFKTFKNLALDASAVRQAQAIDADAAATRQAKASLSLSELAGFAAERAADLMHGWACCVLFNEWGAIFRSEHPALARPVLTGVPKSFLSEAFYDLRAGDDFLREITEQPDERMALLALKPLSAATLPIVFDNGERCGVLVACSRHHWADSAAFEALKRLARVIAARVRAIAPGHHRIPEFTHDRRWERLRDRAFAIDVYRSADCSIPWRYRPLSDTSAILTIGVNDEAERRIAQSELPKDWDGETTQLAASLNDGVPSFAAAIDFTGQSMAYATRGFTPPTPLRVSGPTGALRNAHGITTGRAALRSDTEAAIFDAALWSWLRLRNSGRQLRPLIDEAMPPGFASIVTLGSSRP